MPSYIELDKSPILPSATAEGKVILGVTTQGNLTITNNSGSVSSVGGVTEITREEIEILISYVLENMILIHLVIYLINFRQLHETNNYQ